MLANWLGDGLRKANGFEVVLDSHFGLGGLGIVPFDRPYFAIRLHFERQTLTRLSRPGNNSARHARRGQVEWGNLASG